MICLQLQCKLVVHQKEHKIEPHKEHADQEALVLEQKYFEPQLPILKIIQEKIL